jgi:pentatricopeptide repeat protein
VKPNVIVYSLAIKLCLQAEDTESAQTLMDRMEKSGTPPNVRTYSAILNHWSKAGTPEAAERAEQILMHMKQLAKTKNPGLKPGVFSFNIAMNAWAKSGHSESGQRMWRLYEEMKAEKIEPDFVTYTTLITFFSKSKERKMIQQADFLLQCVEKSKRPDLQPDYRHYVPVIKGWLSIGDVHNATGVLQRSVNKYLDTKGTEVAPNAIIIDVVMQGWIKAGNLQQATALVENMQDLRDNKKLPEGPDLRSYTVLLEAWKKSKHPESATHFQKIESEIKTLRARRR